MPARTAPAAVAPPVVGAAPTVADADLPPLEPDDDVPSAPVVAASPASAPVDLLWRPTDTYGALKRKLELANALIAKLQSQ